VFVPTLILLDIMLRRNIDFLLNIFRNEKYIFLFSSYIVIANNFTCDCASISLSCIFDCFYSYIIVIKTQKILFEII